MKHRVQAKHFNRDVKSRKALLKNLLRDLFKHGEIKTSEARTKEVRRLADKLISVASQNTLAARRELHKVFGRRDVVNTLVDKIAPALSGKKSGFTSLEKLAPRRGDNTTVFKLSLLTGDLKLASLKKEKQATEQKVEAKEAKAKEVKVEKKAVTKKAPAKKPASKAKKSEEKK